MAMERALGLREIVAAIGTNLKLPQLATFACVAKVYQSTYTALLPAPVTLERLWALANPLAATLGGYPRVVMDVIEPLELTTSGLHRGRTLPISWAPPCKDWRLARRAESCPPHVRRLVQRVRPRLYRGFEADQRRVPGAPRTLEDMFDEDDDYDEMHLRTSELFHDIATMSVDGAPGVVLVVHLAYFRTRDEFEGGEEICARLLFSVDGDGEPLRELCHHQQCLFQGELMHGHAWTPSSEEDELPRNCLFDPKFWSVRSDSVQETNRQYFASRFAANDPLRTWDMKQTLDAFLHYAFLIYCSPPTVRHEPWVPIRVPHQYLSGRQRRVGA